MAFLGIYGRYNVLMVLVRGKLPGLLSLELMFMNICLFIWIICAEWYLGFENQTGLELESQKEAGVAWLGW